MAGRVVGIIVAPLFPRQDSSAEGGVSMARRLIITLALALAAGGCAGMSHTAGDQPSAAIPDVSRLAGHWQGTVYETAGSLVTSSSPIDLTIAPDGTWHGTIAKAPASGRAHLRKGRLLLEGTAAEPDGPVRPVHFDLTGDGSRRWGETMATFGGRDGRASVALKRAEAG
jgi:hypothetical protein